MPKKTGLIKPEEQKAIDWTMDYLITLIVHEGQTIGRDEIEKARFALRDSLVEKEEMDAEREKEQKAE